MKDSCVICAKKLKEAISDKAMAKCVKMDVLFSVVTQPHIL